MKHGVIGFGEFLQLLLATVRVEQGFKSGGVAGGHVRVGSGTLNRQSNAKDARN